MDKIRILAVDDEEHVLQVIKNILRNHDLTIETSSIQAAELIKLEMFDIFIIDYQMPGMNGIDLLKEIKEIYKDRPSVSIFCTAYGTIYLFKKELVNGLFTFFLEKPFEVDALKEVMNKAIVKLGKLKNKAIAQQVKNGGTL